eukprot:gene22876-biopygen5783
MPRTRVAAPSRGRRRRRARCPRRRTAPRCRTWSRSQREERRCPRPARVRFFDAHRAARVRFRSSHASRRRSRGWCMRGVWRGVVRRAALGGH